jgi:hypothetical protein
VGLSGTVSRANENELRSELEGVKVLKIPTMRKNEQDHQIVKITKYEQKFGGPTFEEAVLEHLYEMRYNHKNFVLIFESELPLQSFLKKCSAQLSEQFPNSEVVVLNNFDNDHYRTVQALQ